MARDDTSGRCTFHERAAVRRAARDRRATLGPVERNSAARAVRDRLLAHPAIRQARDIAAYSAHGDELDLAPTIAALQALGKHVLLPRLRRRAGRMEFARLEPGMTLHANRFGIAEPPADAPTVAPRFLQVVLVPLAAFDLHGNRLGSGGGYYDRCFAFRKTRVAWHLPRLIGVAFDLQQATAIPVGDWDVPLDGVVTEQRVVDFAKGAG